MFFGSSLSGLEKKTGWRGFALPGLQHGRSALSATIILTFFWALWHLPAFFYLNEPKMLFLWVIGLFAGAIVFTWLFNSTGGSILILAFWYGSFNFMTSTNAGNGFVAASISTLVIIWAILIILIYKSAALSHSGKIAV